MSDLSVLQAAIREFAAERDWNRFHTPKNLAMAVAGEAGELLAEFQWLSEQESIEGMRQGGPLRDRVAAEIADVFIYLLRLADVAEIDLLATVEAKMLVNSQRYPVHLARGSAEKYTQLGVDE